MTRRAPEDFGPLRYLPKHKTAVLGLVSTKTPVLESTDDLKRRIDEASRVADLDQLSLCPQCGFASIEHGNELSVETKRQAAQNRRGGRRGMGLTPGRIEA